MSESVDANSGAEVPLPVDPTQYQGYRGLPVLAGLCSFADAQRPGLSVEESVSRLKRLHYALLGLHGIFTARITAEPIYELKTAFSLHAYLCAEHVAAIRTRVGEMREPPLGLEVVPHPALEVCFDEIRAAATTAELLVGLYEVAVPAVDQALAGLALDTNPLTDAPTCRVVRFARLELADLLQFGTAACNALVSDADRASMAPWVERLHEALTAAGGLPGTGPQAASLVARLRSQTPYKYDPVPRRDERWQDLWNQSVNPEVFLYDERFDPPSKTLMMLFKRLREIDVPEMMASIIVETPDKPWGYYRDMSRQLWDEARHAMMGEVGFVALGIDWTAARISHNWSYRLNTECTPAERHAVLYYIEQGLMTRTGKRYEWEVATASGNPLMRTMQDFDWADEVLHAQLGREWYVAAIGDRERAIAYGDECWSRILSNWTAVRDQGLTQHENWWPTIYRQACRTWGRQPDPQVLSYNVSYAETRADLKHVTE